MFSIGLRHKWYAGGVLGRWEPEKSADEAVKVYFSNPDLLFAGEHPAPRLGQGAFAAALKTLVREVGTHSDLPGMFLPPVRLVASCCTSLCNEEDSALSRCHTEAWTACDRQHVKDT